MLSMVCTLPLYQFFENRSLTAQKLIEKNKCELATEAMDSFKKILTIIIQTKQEAHLNCDIFRLQYLKVYHSNHRTKSVAKQIFSTFPWEKLRSANKQTYFRMLPPTKRVPLTQVSSTHELANNQHD